MNNRRRLKFWWWRLIGNYDFHIDWKEMPELGAILSFFSFTGLHIGEGKVKIINFK